MDDLDRLKVDEDGIVDLAPLMQHEAADIAPFNSPASGNPWYILATVHGEQFSDQTDMDLRARNRRTWNRWLAATFDAATRELLVEKHGHDPEDLMPFDLEERAEIEALAAERLLEWGLELPESDAVNFANVDFNQPFVARGFVLPGGDALFDYATFRGPARFGYATFLGRVMFDYVTFFGPADFTGANFQNKAWFKIATFHDSIRFQAATFQGSVGFDGAIFQDAAAFNTASFWGPACFDYATFQDSARFDGAVFQDAAGFNTASFRQETTFQRGEFKASTVFDNADFRRSPDFRDAQLPFSTTWRRVAWPASSPAMAESDVEHYAALRHAMDTAKRHDAELDFLVRELQARRHTSLPLLHRLTIAGYLLLSDGGRSVGRPALAWVLGTALSVALHASLVRFVGDGDVGITERASLEMVAAVLGNGFVVSATAFDRRKIDRLAKDFQIDIPVWLQAFDIAHVGFSALCLFLMALAVRNWLRLR